MDDHFSLDERFAASVVAGLSSGKRDREPNDSFDAAAAEGYFTAKKSRPEEGEEAVVVDTYRYDDDDHEPVPLAQVIANMHRQAALEAQEQQQQQEALLIAVDDFEPLAVHTNAPPISQNVYRAPYPFYNYIDYSQQPDPDSLTPLTAPGRVPSFPAKMHAILTRPDLKEIIQWQPHGRSWKVLKPREFEVRVIPIYFEHAKFSSFIRQANGWGFRRITTGRDRNSYYHPLFLRGLPHLCKQMKRPGIAEKAAADPDHEPDLAKISEMFPVPLKPADEEAILLPCILQGGPKARMPIYSGLSSLTSTVAAASTWKMEPQESKKVAAEILTKPSAPQWTPRDQEVFQSFGQSLGMGRNSHSVKMPSMGTAPKTVVASSPVAPLQTTLIPAPTGMVAMSKPVSGLAAANNMAFDPSAMMQQAQFAAGFAAAAAMMQSFQQMGTVMAQQQQQMMMCPPQEPSLAPPMKQDEPEIM